MHVWAPAWLNQQLRNKFSDNVTFQKITPGLLGSLRIHNVEFISPLKGTVHDITISLQPWALLSLRPENRKILWVKLNKARVVVPFDPTAPKSHSVSFIPTPAQFPLGCRIRKSEVIFAHKETSYLASAVEGVVAMDKNGIDAQLKTKFIDDGPATLGRLKLRMSESLSWKGEMEILNIPAEYVWSVSHLNTGKLGFVQGGIQVNMVFQGKGPFRSLKHTLWNLNATAKNLTWKRAPDTKSIPLDPSVSADNNGIFINRLDIDEAIHAEGRIVNIWGDPELELKIDAKDWPLANLQNLTFPNSSLENLSGDLNMDLNLRGHVQKPVLEGTFELLPLFGPLRLPPLVGKVKSNTEAIFAEAQFSGGKIQLKSAKGKGSKDLFVTAHHLSLKEMGSANNWKNINGDFSSRLQLRLSTSAAPELTGVFDLANLTWGRNRKQEIITGRIDIKPESIRVDTVDESLTLDTRFAGNVLDINQLRVVFGENSMLSVRGRSEFEKGQFNYSLQGKKIQADIWPPLVTRYPDITGAMDFSGKLFGVKNKPEIQADILVNNLKLIPSGGVWNGTLNLEWNQTGFSLRKIQLDGGYRGDLWVENKDSKWQGEANLVLDQAKPQLLTDILKSTSTTGGVIAGIAQIRFNGPNMVGISSATWFKGSVGKMAFDQAHLEAKMSGNKFELLDIRVIQGSRALRGSGEVNVSGSRLKMESAIHLHQVGGPRLTVDGEIQARGHFSLSEKTGQLTLKAPNLFVNDFAFYNCALSLDKESEHWRGQFNLGENVKGLGRWILASNWIDAEFTTQGLKLEEVGPQILAKDTFEVWPTGQFSATADIHGALPEPAINIDVLAPQTNWRGETFSLQMISQVTSSTMTIKSLKAIMAGGGTLYGTGTANLGSTFLHLNGAGTNLTIQSIFNLIDWPVEWEGKTDGTFDLAGPAGARALNITFAGQHKGFQPFDGSGAIAGTVKYKNHEWDLSGIRVDFDNGYVRLLEGSKSFKDLSSKGRMRLLAETRNLKSGIITMFGKFELVGQWEPDTPTQKTPMELDVFARPLWINQFVLEGNVTHMTIGNDAIRFSPIPGSAQQLSGTIEYAQFPAIEVRNLSLKENGVEKLFLNGAIGKRHWDYQLLTKDTDASAIEGLVDLPVAMSGIMDIRAEGKGNADDPKMTAAISWRNGTVGAVPLDLATFKFSLNEGIIELFDISAYHKKGYTLTGDVRFGTDLLPENKVIPPTINFKIINGNLEILQSMWKECRRSRGHFDGEFNLWEEKGELKASGYLNADNISLRTNSYIPLLRRGRLNLKIDNNRLTINEAKAQIGRGEVAAVGQITLGDKDPGQLDVALKTTSSQGITIHIPELAIPPGPVLGKIRFFEKELAGISRGDVKFDLSLKGPLDQPLLKGDVTIENAAFTFPQVETKKGNKAQKNPVPRKMRNTLQNLIWNVSVKAGNRTIYENDLVAAAIRGSLLFQGPTSDININGRISSQQGSMIYAGNEFKIINADLDVITEEQKLARKEDSQTLVYFSALAEREVTYVDVSGNNISDVVTMEVERAQFAEIQPRFRSKNNPELPSQKAFMLAMGFPPTSSLDEQNLFQQGGGPKTKQDMDLFLRASLVQLVDSSFTSPLARTVARRTGLVDTIRLTYQAPDIASEPTSTPSRNPNEDGTTNTQSNQLWRTLKGTKVKLGREIARGLYADYSFKFDEYQNQLDFKHEVELAYRLQQNLFIRATSELDSQRTLGRDPERKALLEKRWRFGLPKKTTPTPIETQLPRSTNTTETQSPQPTVTP